MASWPELPATSGAAPRSVEELLKLDAAGQSPYLDYLVPTELRQHYGLPSVGSWQSGSTGTFRRIPGQVTPTLRVEVWPDPWARDPALVVELSETYLGQLEASWIVINNLEAPRYDVDRDPRGYPIPLESSCRNIPEELRAFAAGLAPNQVRPGLRLLSRLVRRIEGLASLVGVEMLYVAPLAYHNAIKYERYGFTYASGQEELERIHREFARGGRLRWLLDGSAPFRKPWMADSVRGRSWAIHDQVLGHTWVAPQMYKLVGEDFATCTFPGAVW